MCVKERSTLQLTLAQSTFEFRSVVSVYVVRLITILVTRTRFALFNNCERIRSCCVHAGIRLPQLPWSWIGPASTAAAAAAASLPPAAASPLVLATRPLRRR